MKILHLITQLGFGGASENAVATCLGHATMGHDVTLAFGPSANPEDSLREQASNSANGLVNCVELSALTTKANPWANFRAYAQCRRLIHQFQPDVVHTHTPRAGFLGRLAAHAQRVPVIVHTIHHLPFHNYHPGWQNALIIAGERRAARRTHRFLCSADAMQRQSLDAGVGVPEQYSVLYNGIDPAPCLAASSHRPQARKAMGFDNRNIVIGTVNPLTQLKGHDDLLDGLGPWLRDRPHIKLLWIGEGWCRKRLEHRIAKAQLTDQVIMPGIVSPDRLPATLAAMDLLVQPSYHEGLPRNITKALLAGVPVVSYDCDGAGEICIDGQTGRLIPPGDGEALLNAVRWMLKHPDECKAMIERGRTMIQEKFQLEPMVNTIEKLYQQTLIQQKAQQ